MTLRRTKLSRAFNGIYTVLCAVLRVRLVAKEEAPAPLQFVAANIAANVGACAVQGIGRFKNGAKRNVKPDLHVTVHREDK